MSGLAAAPLRPLLAIHLAPAALFGTVAGLLARPELAVLFTGLGLVYAILLVAAGRWLLEAGVTAMWGAFTFPLAALAMALIAGEGGATVTGMLDNRTRTGFIDAAKAMGADLRTEEDGQATGEDTVRVIATPSRLRGVALDPALVPSMIDELPIFAVLAAFAEGKTDRKSVV